MEGRISLPLFRTGLEIAGLILNEVHIHILFHRMTGNYNRKYLTIDDFLALHPEQDCTIDQFLHAVNGLFDDLTENDYHKMKKRIYRSAKQEQLDNQPIRKKQNGQPKRRSWVFVKTSPLLH
eukprot:TRINITY_DN1981_c0_g1_i1.p1 TRINITY_DN1981_c0_g1~~TRINITY_DN1981_c0_g1_i1.p1  ORF type:complete len:122 (+),score=10.42 TRINITY_DN1981_c0_g1_i1:967-1332(+)